MSWYGTHLAIIHPFLWFTAIAGAIAGALRNGYQGVSIVALRLVLYD